MIFFCNGCEKDRDFDRDYGVLIITVRDGIKRICRFCQRPKAFVPDVFWDGKPEENLANDPVTGKPRVFSSAGEKSTYLKERGLMEAGDRVHGAPVMFHQQQPKKPDTRHEVKLALKKVREMGIDNRRQEYLRITKEGRKYA